MHIYRLLFEKFGPQHWWPADTPFEVMVGAILTQFVSWKNVVQAIDQLKAAGLLSVTGIYAAETGQLEELIRCTRFYKQKAKKLKALCAHIVDKYAGELERFLALPKEILREELLSLYGIGPETADSIILYAANQPVFVVDSYTRRIFSRLGIFNPQISYQDMQRYFTAHLVEDVALFNEYHALIDHLGNGICLAKKPLCADCPLDTVCAKKIEN